MPQIAPSDLVADSPTDQALREMEVLGSFEEVRGTSAEHTRTQMKVVLTEAVGARRQAGRDDRRGTPPSHRLRARSGRTGGADPQGRLPHAPRVAAGGRGRPMSARWIVLALARIEGRRPPAMGRGGST